MTPDLQSTASLRLTGVGPNDLAKEVTSGTLVRVRRGFYRTAGDLEAEAGHRLLIRATLPDLEPDAALSHGSAAILHGLPVPRTQLGRVAVSRQRRGRGHVSVGVHERGCPLPPCDVTVVDEVVVTSLARTVVDLARTLPFDWGVAVADAALRSGLDRGDLLVQVGRSRRWPGNRRARAVAAFADPAAESPGESRSRAILAIAGLPAPLLQYEVRSDGRLLGRSDFCWEEHGVLGEFDGLAKYGRLVRPGERPEDVVVREKIREDDLRAAGWGVSRWTWSELARPRVLAAKVERALALGAASRRRGAA